MLIAKDNGTPLEDHLEQVSDIAKWLVRSNCIEETFTRIGAIETERSIKDLAEWAGYFHDIGKAHPEWQRRITSDSGVPPHSARSAACVPAVLNSLDREFTDEEVIVITLAVLHHHTPINQGSMSDESQFSLSKTERAQMAENLSSFDRIPSEFSISEEDISVAKNCWKYMCSNTEKDLGFISNLLYSVIVQSDHYVSAVQSDGDSPARDEMLPSNLGPSDADLYQGLRPFQKQVERNKQTERLVAMAGCGEGKTHAAVQWGLHQVKQEKCNRLIFALPTQTTTNGIFNQLRNTDGNGLFPPSQVGLYHSEREAVLEDIDTTEEAPLPRGEDQWFQNPVTVSTVDHLANTLVNNYETAGVARGNLAQSAVVFDELHAYDDFTLSRILGVIRQLDWLGIPWFVTSATIPEYLRDELDPDEVIMSDGRLRGSERSPYLVETKDQELTVNEVISEAKEETINRLMVVKNTVPEAKELARTLYNRLQTEEYTITYYSGEFPQIDRSEKEQQIVNSRFNLRNQEDEETDKTQILIATQVCEISLDIDVDSILTDIAPADAIFQRGGRLHRNGTEPTAAECNCPACTTKDEHTYSLTVFTDLSDDVYPYAERPEKDENSQDWDLLQKTRDALEDVGTYTFERSIESVNSAYTDYCLRKNPREFVIASTDDIGYGNSRTQDRFQIRDTSNKKIEVLASTYLRFKDSEENGTVSIFNEEYNTDELYRFVSDHSIKIPQWWIHTDHVSVNNREIRPDTSIAVVNLSYKYTLGVETLDEKKGPAQL